MRQRRETVETNPFGTMKTRMGATHFLMKTLPNVAAEMALHVPGLQYDEGDEYHGCPAADGSDQGIAGPKLRPSRRSAEIPISRTF